MDDKPEIKDLDINFSFSGGSSLKDYLPAPVKKMLKAHVKDIKETTQIDNFKTKPTGEPNPEFGKSKQMFIFEFELDETEAKGQSYSAWVSSAVSERSKLGKISEALLGGATELIAKNADGSSKYTIKDLLGLPLQLALKPGIKNPDRLNVDIDKLLPATDDQVRVMPDVVPVDIPELGDPILDAANEIFGEATTA